MSQIVPQHLQADRAIEKIDLPELGLVAFDGDSDGRIDWTRKVGQKQSDLFDLTDLDAELAGKSFSKGVFSGLAQAQRDAWQGDVKTSSGIFQETTHPHYTLSDVRWRDLKSYLHWMNAARTANSSADSGLALISQNPDAYLERLSNNAWALQVDPKTKNVTLELYNPATDFHPAQKSMRLPQSYFLINAARSAYLAGLNRELWPEALFTWCTRKSNRMKNLRSAKLMLNGSG